MESVYFAREENKDWRFRNFTSREKLGYYHSKNNKRSSRNHKFHLFTSDIFNPPTHHFLVHDVDVRRKSVVARRKYARRPKVYVSKVSMRIETKVAPRWKSRRRGEGTKGEKKKKRKDSKPRIIHERSLELDTLSTTRVLSRCNKAEWEKIAT